MNKIQTLLAVLKQAVPQKIQSRIDKLKELEITLQTAKELNEKEPSDENQAEVDELNGYATELSDSIAAQIEALVEAEQETPPAPAPAPNPDFPPKPIENSNQETDKKKTNFGAAIFIGLVAIVSLGAVVLNKNK